MILTLRCTDFPCDLQEYSKHALRLPQLGLGHKFFSLPPEHLASMRHGNGCPHLLRAIEIQHHSAGLSLHGDNQSKACCLIRGCSNHFSKQKITLYVRVEPWSTRSSITARMGATPVPGPTHMIGIVGSFGSEINPLLIPICSESPTRKHLWVQNIMNSGLWYTPRFRLAKNIVHTPLLGILSLVRYFTIATHRCIWCGWHCDAENLNMADMLRTMEWLP